MANYYLEPTIAPRGPEVTSIEERHRINANARLSRYRDPVPNGMDTGYRQVFSQVKRKPLAPYTSPVSEGLEQLVENTERSRANEK